MISRGHDLHKLLHGYPIDLVWMFYRAAVENQEAKLKAEILGHSIALMNALDTGFNGGKAKILENYLSSSGKTATDIKTPKSIIQQPIMSPRAHNFFQKLPKKENING